MDYVTPEDARNLPGLRLSLTAGVPGPWSEAAKAMFKARNVPYTAVTQVAGGDNEELLAWTGHRNAPTAMYDDESARVTPVEMINLAERLGSGPSLVPGNIEQRIRMFGLINEIAGENGMAWRGRLLMLGVVVKAMGEEAAAANPMIRDYRYSAEGAAAASGDVITILEVLTAQLRSQRENASVYFIGDALSALDIYWACFSQMLNPLPGDVNPMPENLRGFYGMLAEELSAMGYEFDPILLEHRDHVYEQHIGLPLDY